MDWRAALEMVVARTRHARFRALCDDAWPDPVQRDAYRAAMVRLAFDAEADRPTVAQAWDLTRRMKSCPFYSRRPGCCAGARCALRKGDVVSHIDCNLCIQKYG